MKISLELNDQELRSIVRRHFEGKLGEIELEDSDIKIEVKSKQNYRSEWEIVEFRARVEKYEID